MSRCKICDKDVYCTCLCGYCVECIGTYGHEGCKEKEIKGKRKMKGT